MEIFFNKKFLVTQILIIVSLALFAFFPLDEDSAYQSVLVGIAFLLAVPLLYIKIVLKEDLSDYGVRIGNWKKGLFWIPIGLVAAFLILYLFYNYSPLKDAYSLPILVQENFRWFLGYELILVNFFVVLYEFFWRGMVMKSFPKKENYWSVVWQFVFFIVFLLITDQLSWQNSFFIMAAPIAGLIAYQTNSLFYSYLFSLLFIIISDTVFIRLQG